MNRIRKINNQYQVLITPHNSTEAESEYLLAQWSNEEVDDYNIKTFSTMEQAYNESCKYPNINWKFFYLYYIDMFHFLKANIYEAIHTFSIHNDSVNTAILTSHPIKMMYYLMSEEEIKNKFFDRVDIKKNLFRPVYDFSDILIFKIICKNKEQMELIKQIIPYNKVFKIIKVFTNQQKYILTGKTPIGTTYQIDITKE